MKYSFCYPREDGDPISNLARLEVNSSLDLSECFLLEGWLVITWSFTVSE